MPHAHARGRGRGELLCQITHLHAPAQSRAGAQAPVQRQTGVGDAGVEQVALRRAHGTPRLGGGGQRRLWRGAGRLGAPRHCARRSVPASAQSPRIAGRRVSAGGARSPVSLPRLGPPAVAAPPGVAQRGAGCGRGVAGVVFSLPSLAGERRRGARGRSGFQGRAAGPGREEVCRSCGLGGPARQADVQSATSFR